MTAEELNVIIKASGAAQYQSAIEKCAASTDVFKSAVSKLASAFSIAAITKFAKDCVNAASDLSEVQNVVDVAFGDMSGSVSDWAKSEAHNFGLSEISAKKYAGTIGSMATQFGFTQEQAASMAQTLTGLTGDVASFYNLNDQLAFTKLKSVFTGETETLKDIGVVMTQNALDSYAMANGFGKTTKQMTEQEKVALRYQFVLDKLSNATGDFSRTSDGFANSGRTLSLQLEDLKTEIGQELMPAAKELLQFAADGLDVIGPLLKDVARGTAAISSAFNALDAETKAFASDAIRFLSPVAAVVGIVTGNAVMAGLGIAGTIGSLSRMGEEMSGTAESASAFADSTQKASDAVGNLTGEAAKINTFLASFDEVNKVGGSGSSKSTSAFSNIINDTDVANASELSDIIGGLSDSLSGGMTLGIDFDRSIIDGLNIVNDKIEDILSSDWSNFWEKAGEKAYDFKNAWVNALESVGEALYDFWNPDRSKDGGQSHTSAKNKSHGGGTSSFDVQGASTNSKSGYSHNSATSSIDAAVSSRSNYSVNTDTGTHNYFGLQNALNSLKSTVQSATSQAQQQPINITVKTTLDGKEVASSVINNINAQTRSNGKSPLTDF